MDTLKKKLGISLLEILISFSVLALVSAILMYAFGNFRAAQDLSEAHSNIIGVIKEARARTLSSNANSNYGVHFEAAKAVLFKGNSYNALDSENDIYFLPVSTEINIVSLTGGAVETVFTRLNGTTTTSGTISVRAKRNGATNVITLEPTGVVK